MQIGFVGAGRMGRPMLQRLIAAGHSVRVHYRFDWEVEAFTADGAEITPDLRDVPVGAEAVVVNVYSDQQVREVCLDGGLVAGLAPGSLLVVHTTSSPRTSELLAEACAARGCAYVDAAVSGGPHNIAAGEITLFVGGSEAAFAQAQPVLSAYGDPVIHLGPAGTGMKVKLLNNAVFGANIGVLAAAARLAERLDLDEGALLRAVQHGSGNSAVLGMIANRTTVRGFSESTAEFVDKDVSVAASLLADLGAGLDELEPMYEAMRAIRSQPAAAGR
ncbi:NAD(P)-dependent oxidoreductase [Nocardioides sp. YIM 152588]|uniref:NAD(P)-dependent oxidoreductase n=1 Tax=Nocardioides sp. YIM 152588 TaxID=3158259 RepID=UPI0032E3C982